MDSRYTASRDRLGDLKGGSDSTDAFGPSRATGNQQSQQQNDSADIELESQNISENLVAPAAQSDISTMEGYLAEVDDIASCIKRIYLNIDHINGLHDTSLTSINEQQWKKTSNELEQYEDQTSTMNTSIKNRIKALEASNANHKKNSDLNIRQAQAARVKKEFITCIQKYKDIEATFNQKYRQRVARQVRIVKQDVTEEELDEIIDSEQQNKIFANNLSRSGQARAIMSEVQTRHDDIKRIQRTIFELAQLFQDMQMMVENQGQTLDQIESSASEIHNDVEKGNDHISKAIVIARSTRAKKWCCFFITLIIAIVIAILVWWFGFGHPGVGSQQQK